MKEYISGVQKFSNLLSEKRSMIDAFLTIGMSISRIAAHLNRSKSTISDENRSNYNFNVHYIFSYI